MKYFIYTSIILLFWSCSTTKNIPEDKYLLNDFKIKTNSKDIDAVYLEDFVRQKPNTTIPLFGKVRLGIFNMAGQDTSKWKNRFIQKMGQAPILFNARQTSMTAEQIRKELSNQGYLNAEVDTFLKVKNKKVDVLYNINSGTPYKIRNYDQTIKDATIARILRRTKRFSTVNSGELFDLENLEEEKIRMNNVLRNIGYYTFSKENLYYKADTTLNSHQVDLFLSLRDAPKKGRYARYKLRNVVILSGYDVTDDNNAMYFSEPDTSYSKGITIVHGKNNFLRNSMLLRNTYLQPGRFYSDNQVSRTFSAFNGTGAIKQAEINFKPIETEENKNDSIKYIDAQITLAPANTHWFQAGIDGTNSAGDIGIAPSVSYQHQNLFNGAEILSLKLKGAYEFITGSKNTDVINNAYYEYGIEASLSFPQFLFPGLKQSWRDQPSASSQVSVGLTNQHRSEYTRQFFNATYTFRWSSDRNRLNHALDLLDVNYIRMPWISDSFRSQLNANPILNETYKNQLIARTSYNLTYTKSDRANRYPRSSHTIRTGTDVAGLIPRLVSTLNNAKDNSKGEKEILGIAYAEYIKGDFSYSQTINFNKQRSIAYNIAVGIAQPYGNSNILPFEKRYFAGGANGVRGWSTRRLGPGAYKPNDSTSFVNQAGDIKLDLSFEYRNKISEFIELAGFVDAGNIWTIREYEGQEGGLFKFSNFYEEIALAYGLGIRFDLGFLLVRFDTGMKAYDPSRDKGDRLIIFKPKFSRDVAFHFAIGYPF